MNAQPPAVSVVIPTFDRRPFVLEAIRSVLEQTVDDLEVVVVDDGSTDGTLEAVEGVADPRVRCVRKEHSGIAATRNRGLAESRGRFVAFLDSDDLWVPEKLEKQLPLLEGENGFVYARYRSVRDGETLRSKPVGGPSGRIFLSLINRIFVQTSTAVVKREVIDAVGGFDASLRYADEYDFFLRLAERTRAGFVDEDLVIYRIHGGNESRNRERRVSENLEVYRRLFARSDLTRRARKAASIRVARYAVQLGRLRFEAGDVDGAARCFREAVEARPFSLAARSGLWKTRSGRGT
jgi:glycosyltransferase involved in cell wall biosynthesis